LVPLPAQYCMSSSLAACADDAQAIAIRASARFLTRSRFISLIFLFMAGGADTTAHSAGLNGETRPDEKH